ncbi:hypothetical protein [Ornithinibacillus sp. 179-J 7C1 HS]|uniref:hypothetical protein n=1 Tax=Ornithinibacillus sp. 179-J 7C1 HS TaxID=3142384 RepID=UPI0039A030E4
MKKVTGLKKKIIVGAVAVGIISGSGVALANTDAGQQLRAWYDGMFEQSVGEIEEEVSAYTNSKMPEIQAEYEQLKSEAQVDIDLARELETGNSLEEIINAKLSHLESLSAEEQAILENIGLEFYNVFLNGYGEIERLEQEGLNYATNDLTAYTGEIGEEAMATMTSDINTARDEAVQELEEAIRQAQEGLAAELDSQEEITIRNLKNQVDWAIEDLREAVTTLLDGLVEEQEQIIIAHAQELEDQAKAALDDVVNSINQ